MNHKRLKSGEAQNKVLDLVQNPDATIYQTALAYRRMLQTPGRYDWNSINSAIVERWTEEGWMRMMRVAWDHKVQAA